MISLLQILLEKLYREANSTFTHENNEYNLNKAIKYSDSSPIKNLKVNDLKWVLKYTKVQKKRVKDADVSEPLLVTQSKGKIVVLDGAHRLTKAVEHKMESLPTKNISAKDLEKCKVK